MANFRSHFGPFRVSVASVDANVKTLSFICAGPLFFIIAATARSETRETIQFIKASEGSKLKMSNVATPPFLSQRRTGLTKKSPQRLSALRPSHSTVTKSILVSTILLLGWLYTVVIPDDTANTGRRNLGTITATVNNQLLQNPPRQRRLGMLVGIFTADFQNDREYRSRHRKLFTLWNDPRVCSLGEFEQKVKTGMNACELIYTFVVGANPAGPTEWMETDEEEDGRRHNNPILVTDGIDSNFTAPDLMKRDVTRMNIR